MCCIFTCCGWMIDLIQRFWTFAMSCCISSAVCCALITSAMSGIALGYNYSLAEYIDLKETNVSVYLKRGVFDDEISDDIDWRRSGHMPVAGHLKDDNLITAPPDNEEMPYRAGRRMDDSMVISDDHNKFEGSLMRLTVKPPSYSATMEPVTSDEKLGHIINSYTQDSLNQIKAIHGLMNMRRANNQRSTKTTPNLRDEQPEVDLNGRRLSGVAPGGVGMYHGPYEKDLPPNINPARLAVPDPGIGRSENWFLGKDKIPETYKKHVDLDDYQNVPPQPFTYPTPIRYTYELKRPTRPMPPSPPTRSTTSILKDILRTGNFPDVPKDLPEDEVQLFKSQMVQDKDNFEKLQRFRMKQVGDKVFKSEDDYADQANKGLPIRRKRSITSSMRPKLNKTPLEDSKDTNVKKYEKKYDITTVINDEPLTIIDSRTEEKVNAIIKEASITKRKVSNDLIDDLNKSKHSNDVEVTTQSMTLQ